jgi:hypothetical protein
VNGVSSRADFTRVKATVVIEFAANMISLSAASLTPHPWNVGQLVYRVEAELFFDESQRLKLVYRINGALNRLKVPVSSQPRHADGLWQHTCFEAFIKESGSSDYYEFNFSPSGEWAAYAFRSYRDGGRFDDDSMDPAISVNIEDDRLVFNAAIGLARLPAIRSATRLLIGLSAVIEAIDGSLSYWALKHPLDKPDFHHSDSFALELALPGERA